MNRLLPLALLSAVLACGDDPAPTEPAPEPEPEPEATTLAAVGGVGQTARVDSALAQPLAVRVDDQNGDPFEGATVRWRITAGGGTLEPTSGASGSDGIAETVWTLGSEPGTQEAIAYVTGVDTVTFTATAEAPPEPFELEIDDTVESFTIDDTTGESQCVYTLVAHATGGESDAYAQWLDGEVEWRKNNDVIETEYLSDDDVLDFWGASIIHTGDAQEAAWRARWTGEFVLLYTFRYELPSGERRSVTDFVYCEP